MVLKYIYIFDNLAQEAVSMVVITLAGRTFEYKCLEHQDASHNSATARQHTRKHDPCHTVMASLI